MFAPENVSTFMAFSVWNTPLTLELRNIPGMTSGNHQRVPTETSKTEILLENMLHLLDSFIQTDLQHHERGQFIPDSARGNRTSSPDRRIFFYPHVLII